MLVELHVFSGRPDPRWQLDEHQLEGLRRLLDELSPSSRQYPAAPGLGYRGFSLRGRHQTISVYRGFVRLNGTVLEDPTRGVERYLLAQAPTDLAAIVKRVASELEGQGP